MRLRSLLGPLWLALLAACSLTPSPPAPALPTAPPRPTATSTAAPRPTAAPAVTAQPAPTPQPAALQLWAAASGPQAQALQRLIGELAAPQGLAVNVTTRSSDALYADISADRLAGEPPPDLIWATQEELALLQRDKLIQPAADGVDERAVLPATLAGAALEGQRWGTPVAASGMLLLFYNRKLVSGAPASTDALIVASRAQRRDGNAGLVAGWAEPRWFAALLAGYGGSLVGPDNRPTLDTPQTLAALNLLKELRVAGPPAPSTYGEGARLFQHGKAAFALDGDWAVESYRQYTDTLELGVARMPVVPATGRVAAPPLNGIYLMYSSALSGERQAQARKLAAALLQPDAQARIARDLGLLPALKSALASPAVQQHPLLGPAAAQADGAAGLPATRGLHCAWETLAVTLPSVLVGDLAPAKAAPQLQSDALACLSRTPE